jgi:hypothetical protein
MFAFFLMAALAGAAQVCEAQIATTGPGGLAREMPRIYGPYMANSSRIKNQQKQKNKQKHKRKQKSNGVSKTRH